jgi:hypothetical protein
MVGRIAILSILVGAVAVAAFSYRANFRAGSLASVGRDKSLARVDAYLMALNSGEAERMRRFFVEESTLGASDDVVLPQRVESCEKLHARFGKLFKESAEKNQFGDVYVRARSGRGEAVSIIFVFNKVRDGRIASIGYTIVEGVFATGASGRGSISEQSAEAAGDEWKGEPMTTAAEGAFHSARPTL